jgi:REP element-mobilizing transposase RayT
MTLYRDRYLVESARLKYWDYTSNGYYFVTICTQDRKCLFGNVADKKMQLSEMGEMVAKEWQNTKQIRPNVEIDEWIVMPNHLHGIIVINNVAAVTAGTHCVVETHCNVETHLDHNQIIYLQ